MDRAELQAVQLALALVLGLSLGLMYDVYRVWFRNARGAWRRGVGDILWWALAFAYSAAALYYINGMELRLPVLALALAGVCLYMGFFSPVIFPVLHRLLRLIFRLLRQIWRLWGMLLGWVLLPVVWAADLVLRLLGVMLRPFGWLWRRLRAGCASVRARIKKPAKGVDFAEEEVDFPEENDI